MKKALAVLFAAALALSMSTGVFAAETNIALAENGGKFEASSTKESQPLSNVNDGDVSSFWEAADPSSTDESLTVSWEKAQNIDKIVLIWGGGKPKVDSANGTAEGYSAVEYTVDGTNWTKLDVSISREGKGADGSIPFYDTFAWDGGAFAAKALRVNFAAFAMNGAYQCYEFEVYGTEAPVVEDTTDDDKTESDAPAADDKEDDKTETSKPDTSKPADKPATNPDTGVESVAIWAVLFAAAAAVVLTVKKVKA